MDKSKNFSIKDFNSVSNASKMSKHMSDVMRADQQNVYLVYVIRKWSFAEQIFTSLKCGDIWTVLTC